MTTDHKAARTAAVLELLRSEPGGLTAGAVRNRLGYPPKAFPGAAYLALAALEAQGLVRCTSAPTGHRSQDENRAGAANWFAADGA